MASIRVDQRVETLVEEQAVEFVERKGVGHPDSLMDGIVENVSLELDKYYIDIAGNILHHNVDKGLIIGGAAEVDFGKGIITTPIEVIVAGRATQYFENEKIPIDEIAAKATRDYLAEHTRFLDLDKEIKIDSKILGGSGDLNSIFKRGIDVPLANDTSFGMGFAPYSETERLTLETERFLNGAEYKKKMPMVGEDIKVMAIREQDKIMLTIAIAFVAPLVKSIEEYIRFKEQIIKDTEQNAKRYTQKEVKVVINHGDSHEKRSVYLTKSGLSCESGDDGSVGRGNRVNGLITPFRHMSLEAAAGKNPVNHVGKIYCIVSKEIAEDIVKLYPKIRECNVGMVSQIGRRIDDPANLYIYVIMEKGEKLEPISSKVRGIAEETLGNISYITQEIAQGKYEMF